MSPIIRSFIAEKKIRMVLQTAISLYNRMFNIDKYHMKCLNYLQSISRKFEKKN